MFHNKLLITLCAYSIFLMNVNDCYCMEGKKYQNDIQKNNERQKKKNERKSLREIYNELNEKKEESKNEELIELARNALQIIGNIYNSIIYDLAFITNVGEKIQSDLLKLIEEVKQYICFVPYQNQITSEAYNKLLNDLGFILEYQGKLFKTCNIVLKKEQCCLLVELAHAIKKILDTILIIHPGFNIKSNDNNINLNDNNINAGNNDLNNINADNNNLNNINAGNNDLNNINAGNNDLNNINADNNDLNNINADNNNLNNINVGNNNLNNINRKNNYEDYDINTNGVCVIQ